MIARDGIVGKHAGDGGSALFLAADFDGSESAAARAAIEAARAIRDGAERLGPDDVTVKLNIGVHWGATLMVGQVATSGRLEVTALGDQMNEGARIEAAAKDGAILASKDLIERLDADDAQATGLDPDAIAYTPLGELDGASDKAIRDAGSDPRRRDLTGAGKQPSNGAGSDNACLLHAAERSRTSTALAGHKALNLARLPVPPQPLEGGRF